MAAFTTTQQKILTVLSDGMPHTFEELHRCLPDQLSGKTALKKHISIIRKTLHSKGQAILCELSQSPGTMRKRCYRHVRLLASAANGYR